MKKAGIELELLTDLGMLLMVGMGIRGEMCHFIHRYAKANNRYMKDYKPSKESSYLMYLDVNNLHGSVISRKLPLDGFEWRKVMLAFGEKFVQKNKTVTRDAYSNSMLIIPINSPSYIVLGRS